MNTSAVIENSLNRIIENARFAPSVHNTQPWIVRVENNNIKISIEDKYQLQDGDPTGRETIISLGIFAEAVVICAQTENLEVKDVFLSNKEACLEFKYKDTTETNNLVTLIRKRATDRSIYKPTSLDKSAVNSISTAKSYPGTNIFIRTDPNFITKVAELTSKAIGLALSSPGFRQELAEYLVLPWSNKKRGISVNSLSIAKFFAIIEPRLLKLGLAIGKEAKLEKKRWQSASAVVCITAKGDMPEHWFATGRTYLQVALKIESLDLSQATSAALVEASTYHEDIEQLLDTKQRLLGVIRVGKGVKKRHYSPRVPTDELIAT